jgi:hypothetical protein
MYWTPCHVLFSDVRLQFGRGKNDYTYPDVLISCDLRFEKALTPARRIPADPHMAECGAAV